MMTELLHAGHLSIALSAAAFRGEELRNAVRAHEAAYRAALEGGDLSFEELELMVAIVREWFPNLSKLARALDRDRSRLRPMIAALEKRGLLSIKRSRRRRVLSLTPEGVIATTLGIASCRIADAEIAHADCWSERMASRVGGGSSR